MNIWLLVWFLAAAVILYFSFWNLLILIRQKQIWKAFSERTGLRYEGNGLTSSPSLSGSYKDYAVSLFMGEHGAEDQRGMRKLTAIEVSLKTKIPFEGGVASAGMKPFLVEAGFTTSITPENDAWPQDMAASSPTPYALKKYLSDDRIEGLVALAKLKHAWLILIFKDDVMLLRMDTPDALASNKKLSILLNKMVNVAKSLELGQGEGAILLREMERGDVADSPEEVLSSESSGSVALELEEDDENDMPQDSDSIKSQPTSSDSNVSESDNAKNSVQPKKPSTKTPPAAKTTKKTSVTKNKAKSSKPKISGEAKSKEAGSKKPKAKASKPKASKD